MTKFLFFLILSLKIYSQDLEAKRWFYSAEKNIKGVAFTFHGLNAKPSTMDYLARFFNKEGVHVLRGSLTGHFGSLKTPVTRDIWLSDVKKTYTEAFNKAQKLKVPLFFAGHSLGALLFLDLVSNSKENILVDKMIFFSPAISIAAHLRFLSFIFYLPGSLRVPSRNLPEYRSDDYTSFSAYDALWTSYGKIKWDKITPPRALIFMDGKDELLSFEGVEIIVKKIPGWELFEVDTSGSRNSRLYHHLTFNEKCYALGVWKNIEKKMENFLWPSSGTP